AFPADNYLDYNPTANPAANPAVDSTASNSNVAATKQIENQTISAKYYHLPAEAAGNVAAYKYWVIVQMKMQPYERYRLHIRCDHSSLDSYGMSIDVAL